MNIVFQKFLSLQLAKQLAELLKIFPLLKIQLMLQMTILCLPSRYIQMNHSLQKCFKSWGKKAMGRERKPSGKNEKNLNSATSFLKPPVATIETFFAQTLMLLINVQVLCSFTWNLSALKYVRYSE